MNVSEVAAIFVVEMLRRGGVREWDDTAYRQAVIQAANELAAGLAGESAMASKALLDEFDGTPAQITFRDVTDFSPATNNDYRHGSAVDVECQLDTTGVANAAARQSDKVDLGAVRAPAYALRGVSELAATPTAGNVIGFYWAPSNSGTAARGNPGGVSGADGAYTGDSSNLSAGLRQLDFIGNFICTEVATAEGVQKGEIGILVPKERYGSLVVVNESGAAFHSDAVETHYVLDPIYIEQQ